MKLIHGRAERLEQGTQSHLLDKCLCRVCYSENLTPAYPSSDNRFSIGSERILSAL